MVVALLVVPSHVHFVLYYVVLLKLLHFLAKNFPVKMESKRWKSLNYLGKIVNNNILIVAHVHNMMDKLINYNFSSFRVA